MRDVPVCLCQWYHTRERDAAKRLAARALRDVPENQRAHLRIETVFSRLEFIKAIRGWYETSGNTQYLLIVAHGVENRRGHWIGIGSSPGDDPVGKAQRITWAEFWKEIVTTKTKPPALLLVGCKTSEAVNTFVPPLLTRRENNPYLIGLTEVVSRQTRPQAYRLAVQLLQNIHERSLFLDEEVDSLREEFPTARLFYPVVALKRQPPRYVPEDRMEAELGLSFRQYLDHQNKWLAARWQKRHRRRAVPRRPQR